MLTLIGSMIISLLLLAFLFVCLYRICFNFREILNHIIIRAEKKEYFKLLEEIMYYFVLIYISVSILYDHWFK